MIASACQRDKTLLNVKRWDILFLIFLTTLPSRLLDCIHLYIGNSRFSEQNFDKLLFLTAEVSSQISSSSTSII